MNKTYPILVAVLVLAAGVQVLLARPSEEDRKLAKEKIKQGARVVDVRTPEEFAAGHYEGATNIPVQVLDQKLGELGDTSKPIVVYCKSGARAGMAKKVLEKAGFTDVTNAGGLADLQKQE